MNIYVHAEFRLHSVKSLNPRSRSLLFPPNNFRIHSFAIYECNLSPRAYYSLENVNRFHLWTLYANFTFFKLRAEVRSLVNSPLRNIRVFKAAILQLFGQRYIRAFSADRPSIRASLLPCVVNYRAISTAPPMSETDQACQLSSLYCLDKYSSILNFNECTAARTLYGSRLKDKNRCGVGRITCYCAMCVCVYIYIIYGRIFSRPTPLNR